MTNQEYWGQMPFDKMIININNILGDIDCDPELCALDAFVADRLGLSMRCRDSGVKSCTECIIKWLDEKHSED